MATLGLGPSAVQGVRRVAALVAALVAARVPGAVVAAVGKAATSIVAIEVAAFPTSHNKVSVCM